MIRRLISSDIPVVLDLWLQNVVQAHPYIIKTYWKDNLDLVREMLQHDAETYVFIDKHKIKGFVSLLADDFIGALFVDVDFRAQHIGAKLLKYVIRRRAKASLRVYAANNLAIDFYHKNGFKIIKEQFDEPTGQKELLMSWAKGCKSVICRHFGAS